MPRELSSGVIIDGQGRKVQATILIDRQNLERIIQATNKLDGTGFFSVPLLRSDDMTIKVLPDEPGWNAPSFYLSEVDDPDPAKRPVGVSRDLADPTQLRIALERSRPFDVRESGIIRVQGRGFVREDGSPWFFAGYAMHILLPYVARGDEQVLHRQFEYMDRVGANTVWTFGCHLSPYKVSRGFFYDPRQADCPRHLARLCDIAAEHQKRIAYGLFTDCQYGLQSVSEQVALWRRDGKILKNRWNVWLYAPGNEDRANGWYPGDFPRLDVGSVLQSRGDRGADEVPFFPYWDVNLWETRTTYGSPARPCKVLDDAGAGNRELQDGYTRPDGSQVPAFDGPLAVMETEVFADTSPDHVGDRRNTDPAFAYDLGANIKASCHHGCFATSRGLDGEANGDIADRCARNFYAGFWGLPPAP